MDWSVFANTLARQIPNVGAVFDRSHTASTNALHDAIASNVQNIQLQAVRKDANVVKSQAAALAAMPQIPPMIQLLAEEIVNAASQPMPDYVGIASICGLINAQNTTQATQTALNGSFNSVHDYLHYGATNPHTGERVIFRR